MRLGVHLPQYGRGASPASMTRVARHAEDLGFDDVWVSDHLTVPQGAPYPPPFLYEPVVALTWAAAVTTRVGLGTSVLVLPYRHPLHLAKELATLDELSQGRLILGAAAGWLEGEFEALSVPFDERGARTDEALDALRACWDDDPTSFAGPRVTIRDQRILPKPTRRIPIWIGGGSPAALTRAARVGDGWHGIRIPAHDVQEIVRRFKAERGDDFVISFRVNWDGVTTPADEIKRERDAYVAAGVEHFVACPAQPDLDRWLAAVDGIWSAAAS